MKKNTIVEIISALFILLFLYTALSKTFQINNTVNVLLKTPIFANIAKDINCAHRRYIGILVFAL